MFLNRLEQEEKEVFLQLAHYLARNSEDFTKDEKDMIRRYCLEMQIDNVEYDEKSFDLKTALCKITNKKSQKIFFLEILTLVYSDGILDTSEENILDTMMEIFHIDKSMSMVYSEWAKAVLALYVQGEILTDLQ